jgi:hypothetical protein
MAKPELNLQQQQHELTRYLRDPEHCAPPESMNAARVKVYRDLVFNNLLTLLSGTFPVLVRTLGDQRWRTLLRIFLRDHRAQTPKFGEIAEEFLAFIASEPAALSEGQWPAFMVELAHYEWVEMALQQSSAEPLPDSDAALLLDRPLRVSPLAWPLAYSWPVQHVGPDYHAGTPPAQPTLLLVRRSADFEVRFSELSPLAWRLLQRLEEAPQLTGRQQLQALAVEAGMADVGDFMDNGLVLLQQLHEQGVIGVALPAG